MSRILLPSQSYARRSNVFFRSHQEKTGTVYFYFPSYEIVRDYFGDPFLPDNRHLDKSYSDAVIGVFARHYTTLPEASLPPADALEPYELDLVSQLAALDDENQQLQAVCDGVRSDREH